MSQPVTEQQPLPLPETPEPPKPSDVAARQHANAAQEPPTEEPAEEAKARSPEQYEEEIKKLRKENANWRTKYREAEPIVQKHQEQIEAEKSEAQKALERAEAAEQREAQTLEGYARLELAVQYNLSPDLIDLLGSGSREQMEERALRLAALQPTTTETQRPPTNRPVEGLRPGATPEPPKPVDNSYPASWGFTAPRQQ